MIYNKLITFWKVLPLLLLLPLCIIGCHRDRNQGENDPQTGGSDTEMSSDMTEYEGGDMSFETVLQPLAQGDYYRGECKSLDGSFRMAFLATLDDVKEKSFSAVFYDITDERKVTVSPESLSGAVRLRKIIVTCKDKEMVLRKLKLAKTATGIKGSFNVGKQPYEFYLDKYEKPEYKEFEKRYVKENHPCKIIKNVKYGEAMGYWTSNVTEGTSYFEIFAKGVSASAKKRKLDLLMDVYLPENDDIESRPLIVFIHGGAFYIGDKTDNPIQLWCKHFAACGYVVTSINYRMGFQLTKTSIERCGYSAVQDAHAALRFLLSKKDEYGINPDYIFVAGSSAGAITSLNLAFMRNDTRPATSRKHGVYSELGDIESSGNTLKQDFHIRAIANMWGAVNDLAMLEASRTNIVSFHGDADRVVPYDSGIPFSDMKVNIGSLFFGRMYGSASINRKARQLGYRSELHTFPDAGHAPHVDENNQPNQKFYYIQEHITDFFFKEFVPPTTAVVREPDHPQWFRLAGEDLKEVFWKVDGGFILQTEKDRARVVFVEGKKSSLRASALFENGASFVFFTGL